MLVDRRAWTIGARSLATDRTVAELRLGRFRGAPHSARERFGHDPARAGDGPRALRGIDFRYISRNDLRDVAPTRAEQFLEPTAGSAGPPARSFGRPPARDASSTRVRSIACARVDHVRARHVASSIGRETLGREPLGRGSGAVFGRRTAQLERYAARAEGGRPNDRRQPRRHAVWRRSSRSRAWRRAVVRDVSDNDESRMPSGVDQYRDNSGNDRPRVQPAELRHGNSTATEPSPPSRNTPPESASVRSRAMVRSPCSRRLSR